MAVTSPEATAAPGADGSGPPPAAEPAAPHNTEVRGAAGDAERQEYRMTRHLLHQSSGFNQDVREDIFWSLGGTSEI